MPLFRVTGMIQYWIDINAPTDTEAHDTAAELDKSRWATVDSSDKPTVTDVEEVEDD